MTTETTHRIEPGDITRLSFECNACHTTLEIVVDGQPAHPHATYVACPRCRAEWLKPNSYALTAIPELLAILKGLVDRKAEMPFTLGFQVPPPAEEK